MSDDIRTGPYPGTYALVTPDKPALILAGAIAGSYTDANNANHGFDCLGADVVSVTGGVAYACDVYGRSSFVVVALGVAASAGRNPSRGVPRSGSGLGESACT